MGIALFFREVRRTIRDDEAEVSDAGVIHARVVHLVENAVAQGEPHPALAADRGTEAALRASGPTSWNARPAWSEFPLFNHGVVFLRPSSSCVRLLCRNDRRTYDANKDPRANDEKCRCHQSPGLTHFRMRN